jgi:hypothetical protein
MADVIDKREVLAKAKELYRALPADIAQAFSMGYRCGHADAARQLGFDKIELDQLRIEKRLRALDEATKRELDAQPEQLLSDEVLLAKACDRHVSAEERIAADEELAARHGSHLQKLYCQYLKVPQ